MSHRVLRGPFLTRAQAARRAGVPVRLLRHRPDLLVVDSEWLPEVYFAFQFDDAGVQPDVGALVQNLRNRFTDVDIADWLVRPNRMLGLVSPLAYLTRGGEVADVLTAADAEGPTGDAPPESVPPASAGVPARPAAVPAPRTRVRRPRRHRPILHGS